MNQDLGFQQYTTISIQSEDGEMTIPKTKTWDPLSNHAILSRETDVNVNTIFTK